MTPTPSQREKEIVDAISIHNSSLNDGFGARELSLEKLAKYLATLESKI